MIVDEIYKNMILNILDTGIDTVCRARWKDGSIAHTIKKFGIINTYDLREEFPIPTIRPIPKNNCVDELLWIWQKKSNNIKDLNSHIWDSWADKNGCIGKAYGYQIGNKLRKIKITDFYSTYENKYNLSSSPKIENMDTIYLDQMDFILYELQTNPASRRIVANMFEIDDLGEMNLEPCCYSVTFNTEGKVLNMILNQRSADLITAGFWNVFQYALLLKLVARHCGFEAGKLIHVIADAHIYDRHIDIAKELLVRTPYNGATLSIEGTDTNFYSVTPERVCIYNYKYHDQIKNIEVAI